MFPSDEHNGSHHTQTGPRGPRPRPGLALIFNSSVLLGERAAAPCSAVHWRGAQKLLSGGDQDALSKFKVFQL